VQLYGARDADQLRGTTRYWDESPGTFRRAMEARFRGEAVFQEEARFRTLDGRLVDALFTAARPGPPDRLNASIIGLNDVTERTRAQERLRRVQAELAHAARVSLLGELVASIAHEINQPLAAIIANGGAGIRWIDRPQPELRETLTLLQRIVVDAERAAQIIRNIRAMATRREPELKPLEFADVVRESTAFLQHEFKAHNVTVRLALDETLPAIAGDRTQLQQVLVNLVLNAVQAMAGDSLRRILRIRAWRAGDGALQCSLEDSGPGIAEDDLPNMFDSFFTTKADGLGMGLAISRSIVEAHGGQLTADNASELGGARFLLRLPASDPQTGN
jgi:C4-dicarboxylate-specific signal transduction histidine kinase